MCGCEGIAFGQLIACIGVLTTVAVAIISHLEDCWWTPYLTPVACAALLKSVLPLPGQQCVRYYFNLDSIDVEEAVRTVFCVYVLFPTLLAYRGSEHVVATSLEFAVWTTCADLVKRAARINLPLSASAGWGDQCPDPRHRGRWVWSLQVFKINGSRCASCAWANFRALVRVCVFFVVLCRCQVFILGKTKREMAARGCLENWAAVSDFGGLSLLLVASALLFTTCLMFAAFNYKHNNRTVSRWMWFASALATAFPSSLLVVFSISGLTKHLTACL